MKASTKKFIVDLILGAVLGLVFFHFYPQGVSDRRWWIGMFGSLSIIHTYMHFTNKLTQKQFEEENEDEND